MRTNFTKTLDDLIVQLKMDTARLASDCMDYGQFTHSTSYRFIETWGTRNRHAESTIHLLGIDMISLLEAGHATCRTESGVSGAQYLTGVVP